DGGKLPTPLLEAMAGRREGSSRRPSSATLIATLAKWKSPRRLANLVRVWRNNRFPGDEAAFALLESRSESAGGRVDRGTHNSRGNIRNSPPIARKEGSGRNVGWRPQDRHLYDWQCNDLARMAARRLDVYRKAARGLARKYKTLVLKKKNW